VIDRDIERTNGGGHTLKEPIENNLVKAQDLIDSLSEEEKETLLHDMYG